MEQTEHLKIYTFDEVKDMIFGVDTPERREYEEYVAAEIKKEEARRHRVTIPSALYMQLRTKAAAAGQSVSRFVRNTLSAAMA